MTRRQLQGAAKRALRRNGEPATLEQQMRVTDEYGNVALDDHGDPEFTTEKGAVTAIFSTPDKPSQTTNAAGTTVGAEMTVYLAAKHSPVTDSRSGGDAPNSPARIVRDETGTVFEVVFSYLEASGYLRCETTSVNGA